MKKKYIRNYAIFLTMGLLLGTVSGCNVDNGSNGLSQDEVSSTESDINELEEKDICDAYAGINDIYINEGAKDIDLLCNVVYDQSIINGIEVDDEEVNTMEEGTYNVKYEIEMNLDALNKYKSDAGIFDANEKNENNTKKEVYDSGTSTVIIEKYAIVINDEKAQSLADKDVSVYTSKNETVKKSDGSEVVVTQKTPASTIVTGGKVISASTKEEVKNEDTKEPEKTSSTENDVSASNDNSQSTPIETVKTTVTPSNSSASNSTSVSKPSTTPSNSSSSNSSTTVAKPTAKPSSNSSSTSSSGTSSSTSNSSNSSNSNSSSSSASSTPVHTHTWVDVTTTINHPAETHQEDVYEEQQVLVTPAYDEKVWTETIIECLQCGFTTTDQDAMTDHMVEYGHSCHSRDVYTTIHHDAVYGTRSVKVGTKTVVDKEAWTETIVTGQRCSTCGATK